MENKGAWFAYSSILARKGHLVLWSLKLPDHSFLRGAFKWTPHCPVPLLFIANQACSLLIRCFLWYIDLFFLLFPINAQKEMPLGFLFSDMHFFFYSIFISLIWPSCCPDRFFVNQSDFVYCWAELRFCLPMDRICIDMLDVRESLASTKLAGTLFIKCIHLSTFITLLTHRDLGNPESACENVLQLVKQ